MKAYLDILKKINEEGILKENRTGIDTKTIAGAMFEHDMSDGFPLLTTKKIRFKNVAAELEFFIKGITDKQWLQERDVHIWDDWCTPDALKQYSFTQDKNTITIKSLEDDFTKLYQKYTASPSRRLKRHQRLEESVLSYFTPTENNKFKLTNMNQQFLVQMRLFAQLTERDLGPIYGWQWRHQHADYREYEPVETKKQAYEYSYKEEGVDQLKDIVVNTLKRNPNDRRMICQAWNSKDLKRMGLPACHYGFQVIVTGDKLNLIWQQRSVDTPLGLPFNIASYGLLLHLLAKESGFKEGRLVGQLGDTHYYMNQLKGIKEQLQRTPGILPTIETPEFTSIFDWKYTDSKVKNYKPQGPISFGDVAV